MTTQQLAAETDTWPGEMKALLQEVRDKTLVFSLAGLFLTGVLFGTLEDTADPGRGIFCALAAFLLCLLVWLASRWNHLCASWLLVSGWCAVMLLMATWASVVTTIWLLPLSVGMAALLVSFPAGAVTAASLTILLLVAPGQWLPAEPAMRVIAVLSAWVIMGLVWLAMQPIHIVGEWAWSAYERS